jgi:hypothetical protein
MLGAVLTTLRVLLLAAAGYLLIAYVVLPAFWRFYEPRSDDEQNPKVTRTDADLPGDPLNIALIGSQEEMLDAFAAAGWRKAEKLGLRSDVDIAKSVLTDRPDPTAPVSNLFLFGRPQDLAFEKEVGDSPRQRHHARFWRDDRPHDDSRPAWIGTVSFDRGVGLSDRTGQVTHHIAPDLDAERDLLLGDLAAAGWLADRSEKPGIGPTNDGRNAGGDPYFTDGMIGVGVLKVGGSPLAR